MAQLKKIGMAAGTFSVALGIGFVMQNGDALASRFGADANDQPPRFTATDDPVELVEASFIAPEARPADLSGEELASQPAAQEMTSDVVELAEAPVLETPEPALTAAVELPDDARIEEVPQAPVQLASVDPEVLPEVETVETSVTSTTEIDCVPNMMAAAGEAATVDVAISAPCHLSTAFTIHHQGMMFTATTNDAGVSKISVPALAEVAVLIAAFDNGDGAVATVTIPDFAEYDRAVLQWQGDTAVMLSAYENGAAFGDPSHIHGGNPGDMARISTAEGGFLMTLGDSAVEDALMAEVYTFPSAMVANSLDVMLVAEAEITAGNCGQELEAQSIQVSPTGETTALDLQMMMPDCDAVGDFLILQNMFEDLTLAAR